jgi:hypothetical protein
MRGVLIVGALATLLTAVPAVLQTAAADDHRNDRREVQQDRRELQKDQRELQSDQRDLQELQRREQWQRQHGNAGAAARTEQLERQKEAEIRRDQAEIRSDERELRRDTRDQQGYYDGRVWRPRD